MGSWIDNSNLQVYTPNGNRDVHTLVVEFTQASDGYASNEDAFIDIPRLAQSDLKALKLSDRTGVVFQHYQGPNNSLPPTIHPHNMGKSFDGVIKTDEIVKSSIELDSKWIVEIIQKADDKPVIEKFVKSHDQQYPQLVADMQLFKFVMQIKWSNPHRWKTIVVRPGGLHTLMSFVGCIGTLMSGTGLEEILSAAFSGVGSMLNDKAWPKALRGFRMMTTILLEGIIASWCNTSNQVLKALSQA